MFWIIILVFTLLQGYIYVDTVQNIQLKRYLLKSHNEANWLTRPYMHWVSKATLYYFKCESSSVDTLRLQTVCLHYQVLSLSGWHTLPSHASAEVSLISWPNAQPQGRDYCSVARHHQANLMGHHQANLIVCVVCSCCATSPDREVCRAKGGNGSGYLVPWYLPCSAYNFRFWFWFYCFSFNFSSVVVYIFHFTAMFFLFLCCHLA